MLILEFLVVVSIILIRKYPLNFVASRNGTAQLSLNSFAVLSHAMLAHFQDSLFLMDVLIKKLMNAFVPTIPTWFSARRAAQVTAFFALKCGGKINILMATKLIYLADRLSMERRDAPITGDNFVSMPFGPVNSYTYSYMTGNAPLQQDEWSEFIGVRNKNDLPLSQTITFDDLDELSPADTRILNEVWDSFSSTDRFELAEWTHKFCPEWRDPNGSSIPIDFSTIFKLLGKPNPIELAEDIQAERQFRASLQAE